MDDTEHAEFSVNDFTHESLSHDEHNTNEIPQDSSSNQVFLLEGYSALDVQHSILKQSEPMSVSLTSLSEGNGQIVCTRGGFSIQTLRYCLESCILPDTGEVDLNKYLDAYREICKLMDNLGTVIRTNIGKDVRQKIDIMRAHQSGSKGAFYQTLEKMVTFEKIKKIYLKNPDENGSRTILILHRSLSFIIEFLRSLNTLKVEQGVGVIGRDAYNRTLAPFHQWPYRHIARLALSTLGKKGHLIANFHDGSMTHHQIQEMVEGVVEAATTVYNRCQMVYEKNNFLHLP